jgi:hypothetical protein
MYDEIIKEYFRKLINEHGLADELVKVKGEGKEVFGVSFDVVPPDEFQLPSDEYAIARGKEVIMECVFRGCGAHVFTAEPYAGSMRVSKVVSLSLDNLRNRSIFFCTLNAVMRYLGLTDRTLHCRGCDPIRCGNKLVEEILRLFGDVPVLLVGYQPAMAEALASRLSRVYVTDMNPENIGKEVKGVVIEDHVRNYELLRKVDVALVTGSSVINSTLWSLMRKANELDVKLIVYGVSAAGAAEVLGIRRFCPYGK